ncbi:MAG: toll/interleukin-1 receptor domain-containing protein, partial [Clostridia bacterium]|nr:toll/interleukin-1 receptor domain-containing protein [Clostridia bacterium]
LLGGGVQGISSDLTLIPIINESVEFLRRNEFVKKIYFIDLNPKNAFNAASTMQKMYSLQSRKDEAVRDKVPVINKGAKLFISYNSDDRKVADDLCAKLEAGGIKVWYAPRDIVDNDYASSIVRAISECSHFVTIISKNSLKSEHVLNEIDLAFGELKRNIRFLPLRIDLEELRPAFTYYLSRQHWTDAHVPPLDSRLDEFVEKILGEMN